MNELIERVVGQQICSQSRSKELRLESGGSDGDEEKKGKRALEQVAIGSRSKAMKGLIGGVAHATVEERLASTEALIPRTEDASRAHTADD